MNKTELSNSILEQINRLTPSERDGLLLDRKSTRLNSSH